MVTNTPEAVAETVVAQLRQAGMSRKSLSDETGIPRVTLGRRLSGASAFKVHELEAVAYALGFETVTALIATVSEDVA